MPDAYRYEERSVAFVTLRSLEIAQRQYGIYSGTLEFSVSVPDVNVSRAVFVISGEPAEAFRHVRLKESSAIQNQRLAAVSPAPNQLRILTPILGTSRDLSMPLLIEWETQSVPFTIREIIFVAERPRVRVEHGGLLRTLRPEPLRLNVPAWDPENAARP